MFVAGARNLTAVVAYDPAKSVGHSVVVFLFLIAV